MSTVQRIAKNTSALLVGQILTYLLAFLFVMLAARQLGPAGFGILSFAIAFTAIFAVLGEFGLSLFTTREVARDKALAPKYLTNIGLLKVILAAATFALIAMTINLMGYPWKTVSAVYLLGLSTVLMAFTQMFYSFFRAFEKMEYQSVGQALNSLLLLGGVLIAIRYDFDVAGFAALYPLASFITLVYSFAIYRLKFAGPSRGSSAANPAIDWAFWKSTIRQAFPFALAAVFSVIAFRIDMVMLSFMKGDAAVGWYSAAYKLVEAMTYLPSAFTGAMYPVLSSLYVSSLETLKFAYQKALKYMFILGLPVAVGGAIIAHKVIASIYVTGFDESVAALRILVCVLPFSFVSFVISTILMSINRQALVMRVLLLSMTLNVVLNLLLIPRYSYVGASAATVATSFVNVALCAYFVSKLVCRVPLRELAVKPAVASAIMAAFVVPFTGMYIFFLIPVAASIYFAVLLILRTFSREDFDLLRQVGGARQREQ